VKRHIVTLVLLLLAIVFYSLGAIRPGMVFLLMGGIAELIVWFRIFGRKKPKTD